LVTRGEEGRVGPPRPTLCVAVAPVRARDRVRFLVEKLAELGVDELRWIRTRYGQGAPPDRDKARSWAVGALEQSKGAWLMDISGPVPVDALDGDLLVADPRGGSFVPSDASRYTLVVGPEGGFADGEVPSGSFPVSLSSRILRTETAAIVGAATLLNDLGRQET
jgi:16S rRNA (uracil1498-N3)-methyltransferase